jgi:hypothetical protein
MEVKVRVVSVDVEPSLRLLIVYFEVRHERAGVLVQRVGFQLGSSFQFHSFSSCLTR